MKTKAEIKKLHDILIQVAEFKGAFSFEPYPGVQINVDMALDTPMKHVQGDKHRLYGLDVDDYECSIKVADKQLRKFILNLCQTGDMDDVDVYYIFDSQIEKHANNLLKALNKKYDAIYKEWKDFEFNFWPYVGSAVISYDDFVKAIEDQIQIATIPLVAKDVRLNSSYVAKITNRETTIAVGCQKFDVKAIREALEVYDKIHTQQN